MPMALKITKLIASPPVTAGGYARNVTILQICPPGQPAQDSESDSQKLRRKQIGHNAQDLQAAYDVNDTASHHTPQTALCIIYKMIHLKSPHFKTDPSY